MANIHLPRTGSSRENILLNSIKNIVLCYQISGQPESPGLTLCKQGVMQCRHKFRALYASSKSDAQLDPFGLLTASRDVPATSPRPIAAKLRHYTASAAFSTIRSKLRFPSVNPDATPPYRAWIRCALPAGSDSAPDEGQTVAGKPNVPRMFFLSKLAAESG